MLGFAASAQPMDYEPKHIQIDQMLQEEKFLDLVFTHCLRLGSFVAKDIFQELLPSELTGEEKYYEERNITAALHWLQTMRLVTSEMKPEYTTYSRLLKEIRQGKVTKVARIVSRIPRIVRLRLFWVAIRWKSTFLPLLGGLAFLRLLYSAYAGAQILTGWIEYLCAVFVLYIIILLIRRALN